MKATEFIIEGVAGPKNCWPGYRKTGTQPGTGKNKGKRVNDCEKIKEDEVEESGLQYYTGVKKHGKEYMTKAAQAARDGASQEELGALKDRFSKAHKGKAKNESVAEGNSGAKYKIKSIGYDAKGDYYISPSTGKKVYKKGVKVGDHENPKTGEHKGVAEGKFFNSDYIFAKDGELWNKTIEGGSGTKQDPYTAKFNEPLRVLAVLMRSLALQMAGKDPKDTSQFGPTPNKLYYKHNNQLYIGDGTNKIMSVDKTDHKGVAEGNVDEAKYQGREVQLGKKMAGDVKKSKVYVKNPQGNVVKVNFGDKKMRIKKSNPARRKSFRARHNCANPGPRHKARYWSCRSW